MSKPMVPVDFQKLVDTMGDLDKNTRSSYHVTLGELIEILENNKINYVRFDTGGHPANPASYRGYYSDLAFEEGDDRTTGKQMRLMCETTLDRTLQGYKGGDFVMDKDVPLWLAEWGTSSGSRAIVATKLVWTKDIGSDSYFDLELITKKLKDCY